MTAVNLFRALQALVPQPQLAVGLVTEVHSDDTSTVTLPGASSEKELSESLFAGAVVRARGSSVPVGKRALLRAWPSGWVVETQAADGELVEIGIGGVPPAAEPRPTKPVIEVQPPTNPVAYVPNPLTLSVGVSGSAPFAYQWFRNGVAIPGATSSSYTLASTSSADFATYYEVDVSNWVAKVRSTKANISGGQATQITAQPASRSVSAGETATFSVTATGTAPLAYQWRRGGAAIAGATASSYTTGTTTVAGDNGAAFDVVVSGPGGTVTSATATLTVTAAVAPTITTQPASTTVSPPATATFSVVATGGPPPTYQWRRGGVPISGATAASYTTGPTSSADNGATFDVVVSNSAGTVTSAAATLTTAAAATSSGEDIWTVRTLQSEMQYWSAYGAGVAELGGGVGSVYTSGATVSVSGKSVTFSDVTTGAAGYYYEEVALANTLDAKPAGKYVAEFVLTKSTGFEDMYVGFYSQGINASEWVFQNGRFDPYYSNQTLTKQYQGDVIGIVWDKTAAGSYPFSVYINGVLAKTRTLSGQPTQVIIGRDYPLP